MNITNHTQPIESLRETYNAYFSLGHLNTDINTKFALISLINYLTQIVKKKNPFMTQYEVLKQIIKNEVPDAFCRSLAVVCEDFAYGCTQFPTFGIENKQIPAKVKEILLSWNPF